jgi:mannose-1-phosphate guanylyltransferase
VPVDVAVMERSDRVWALPASFAWSDVGTWGALADELGVGEPGPGPGGAEGNRVVGDGALFAESRGNLVWAGDRLVALVGVEDLVVVDTEDVILVTKRDASPDVRRLVERLRKRGMRKFT